MQGSVPDAPDVGSCDSCRMTREDRGLFARSQSDRVILGVAGGIGENLGVDPVLVRFALGAVTIASGLGIVLYLAAWSFSYEPAAGAVSAPPPRMSGWRPVVAMGCIVLGSLLVLRDVGLWSGDTFVWPILIAGAGSTIIWFRSDAAGRARWTAAGGRMVANPAGMFAGTSSRLRLVAGGLFVLFGMTVFLFSHQAAGAAQTAVIAVAATTGGLALILTPWILGLVRDAAAERRERIRSEERAEIAAHLHDSVLHTLALIQRGDVPAEVASVARRQERELRAWLNGRPILEESDLRSAIDAMAIRVEEMHHVPVDTVVVGDIPLDDAGSAIALACQEAAINAARHSGAGRVAVYVEAEAHRIAAYVRDQGMGFDRDLVPSDRRGISESIIGRMRRLGGTATITSNPGEGTEVQMHVPREAP